MAIEKGRLADILTWAMRILAGSVFVFSGFVKGIDPWGTLYKIDSYLGVLGIDLWQNLKLVAAFMLGGVEFLIGVFIIFGCFRRAAAVLLTMVMAAMLPFTLWIALKNPVEDCGCFGDALVISNWWTFWKNVILAGAAIWLLKFNKSCHWLITPALQWIAFIATAVFILIIEITGYVSQPLIDFRPYPVGESLISPDFEGSGSQPHFVFEYEKDSEVRTFTEADILPDESEGWKFIGRKEVSQQPNHSDTSHADRKNLRIWTEDGEDDVTEELLDSDGKQLLIMMPELEKVSPATTWKLNSLDEWAGKNGVSMAAVVSGTPAQIAEWEDLSLAGYPIYTAEDTMIKEVVRGNPGVVYIEDGKVVWKRALNAIYIDDFMRPGTSGDARTFAFNNERMLLNCTYIYLIAMSLLVFLSFSPMLRNFYLKAREIRARVSKPRINHDDKAPL